MKALRTLAWMVALLLAWLVSGCGRDPDAGGSGQGDHSDRQPARRVVCGSPAVTEIVFALGAGDRVVGVSDYTRFPPEACARERIGGLFNPNREKLLALEPDLVISQGAHDALADFTRHYGIRFLSVRLETLADLYNAIPAIAGALGRPAEGRSLLQGIRHDIGAVTQRVSGRSARSTLLVFGRSPGNLTRLTTIGPATFLDEVLRLAGGSNIFHDARGPYPQVSRESLLVRRPEVILEIVPGMKARKTERLCSDWSRFPGLPAVASGQVHALTNEYLLIPGPRVGRTVRRLARVLHPEVFDE